MGIYFCVYILISLTAIIKFGKTAENKRKNQCIAIFMLLFLLIAFRHPTMGSDLGYGSSYNYLGRYSYIAELPWRNVLVFPVVNYERGYIIWNKLLSLISSDQQMLLVGCAALSIGTIVFEIYRKSPSPVLSTFVFMGLTTFLMTYSALRQSIAVGLCFLSISSIAEKKLMKFAALVLLACTFHYSAVVFFVAYPIYHFPIKRNWQFFAYLVPPVFYIFRYSLFQVFSTLLKDNAVADSNNAIELFVVFYLIYIFSWLFAGTQKDIAGLRNLFFVACCIQSIAGVNSLVSRVGAYFMNSLILMLPMIITRMRNRQNARILNIVIGVCFVLFGLYSIYRSSWAHACPYYFFWENVPL